MLKKNVIIIATGIFLCFANSLFSQQVTKKYPQDYFRNPMGIEIGLSANFGEIRKDHYHMGLDIRTQQRENLPVYAAAEGYVSRISIQRGGFGRAIYITHPAGYVTVYAHLNKFYDPLEQYLETKQYDNKGWSQDIDIPAGLFPVTKGQYIALSGNTGASQGPHLHFEIRDSITGNCLNPLLFGFGLHDYTAPNIYDLYWYDRRFSIYETSPNSIKLKNAGSNLTSVTEIVKTGSRFISLGVKSKDKLNNASFLLGIYAANVWVDDSLYSSFKIDDISYNETRYVNAAIDYKSNEVNKNVIQHLCCLPGNRLNIFYGENDGTIYLRDDNPHNIMVEIKDAVGNTTVATFKVQYDASLQKNVQYPVNAQTLAPNQTNVVQNADVKATFDEKAFYDTVHFTLSSMPNPSWPYASATATLHNYTVPVHNNYEVSLRLNNPAYAQYRDKMVMRQQNPKYSGIKKATTDDGVWFKSSFRNLGNVVLMIDTTAPVITPVGWSDGATFGTKNSIRIKSTDNLGTITKFDVVLDDSQWLLFRPSGQDYVYSIDEHCPVGQHTLEITAEDIAGNVTVKTYNITVKEGTVNNTPAKKPQSKKAPVKKKK